MKIKNLILSGLVAFASIAAPIASLAADAYKPYLLDTLIIEQSTNFNGPYASLGVVHSDKEGTAPIAAVGYDWRYDSILLGVEAFSTLEGTPTLGVDVKAGLVVTDNLAVYGIAGVQRDTGKGKDGNSLGIGADLALTENVALTGSYKQVYDLGTFNNRDDQFRVGFKFSF